mgnify:CR=1 FL=1
MARRFHRRRSLSKKSGAEKGTGKSALALNIGENIAMKYDGTVLYFTLESTDIALTLRRFARHARIALTRIRTGNIKSDGEWKGIAIAANELSDNNMIIIEKSRFKWFEELLIFKPVWIRFTYFREV